MDQVHQWESSSAASTFSIKRRRGRPRKDPSLKHSEAAHGFVSRKEYHPPGADGTNGIDIMVGQPVSGVVEATFDAGYLLSVRIDNSDTNLRGVVFKPGHCVPVTAANDVAPNVYMIRRNDVRLPTGKQGWSFNQKLAVRGGDIDPAKRKYSSPIVVLPVNDSNGSTASYLAPSSNVPQQAAHVFEFEDTDVHMVEPLSMLPPDHSLPASQKHFLGSEQNDSISVNEVAPQVGVGEKGNPTKSTGTDTWGSSQTSDDEIENVKETVKSFSEDSGLFLIQEPEPFTVESFQTGCVTKRLFNFESGRMTKLLKAVQENIKDKDVIETESKNDASVA